ncbi:MAG: hypothetical protein J6B41_07055 [Alistipes sp.]|nr:hypothetical protein [Alistipes sp.]
MTKQEFIDRFDALDTFHAQQAQLGDMLHQFLLDGYSVVSFGGDLIEQYIIMLAEMSGIDKDCIDNLLFEGGGMYYINGNINEPFNVVTAEDLWDFYKT